MKTIVLDPGHGGADPGAVNGTRLEKDDNLKLGLAVEKRLKDQGQKVIMTRSTDVAVPLLERSAISNRNNADIFVSLHRNASTNVGANGVENIVQYNSPAVNTTYAKKVLDNIVDVGVQSNRGVKQENFSVLRNTTAPAQLLELGFISNPTDNVLFDKHFDAYADAVTRGILQALGQPYNPALPPPVTPGNPAIKSIQATLNERYNAGLTTDGIFGPQTNKALIKGLQTELNRLFNSDLAVDGVFGMKTKAATPLLRTGSRGNLVYLLQAGLYVNGYPISIDSIYGPNTEGTVRQFQADNGLRADGIAGPETFYQMFNNPKYR